MSFAIVGIATVITPDTIVASAVTSVTHPITTFVLDFETGDAAAGACTKPAFVVTEGISWRGISSNRVT